MEFLVFIILIMFFVAVRASLSVEKPGTLQHVMELIYNYMDSQSEEIIGHTSRRYLSYLITLGMFILCCNLLGLIPFFESPTAVPVVPLGCAIVTWFYYQIQGIRANGFGYIKHFTGPGVVAGSAHVPHRSLQPSRAHPVAHRTSLRQYVCRRHGDPGLLLADTDWRAGASFWPSTFGFRWFRRSSSCFCRWSTSARR